MNYRSLLIGCLATLGLAVASWGQADGKIVFISAREGYEDVWIMNADGSDPVNLTQGRQRHCANPVWSPDGTKIAYIGDVYDDGQYGGEIWLMDADGGNPQQLTDDSVAKISLSWSADGSKIYYEALGAPVEDGNLIDAFVMALDSRVSSPVDWSEVPSNRRYSNRSPDGTKDAIIVLREKGNKDNIARLHIADVGEEPSVIPLPDIFQNAAVSDETWITVPTWSPDSMKIAFSALTYAPLIWAVDIDGSNLVELTNGLGGDSPDWQPVVPAATNVEAQSWGQVKSLLAPVSR